MDRMTFVPIDKGGASCPVCGRRVQCVDEEAVFKIERSCAHYVGTGIIGQQAIVFRTEKSCDQTTAANESTT